MTTVANFLIERLISSKVKHVFGFPGDNILGLYSQMSEHKAIEVVNATDASHAATAADAYARVNGVGAVVVAYNVGGLKIVNEVACAYAERSPLVVISGAPPINEKSKSFQKNMSVRFDSKQINIFKEITCAAIVLDDPIHAGYQIDEAFEAMRHHKQPIYIEIPQDIAQKAITYNVYDYGTPTAPTSDADNLAESLDEIMAWLSISSKPAIIAGVEIARFGMGKQLAKFAERINAPILTTLLSKSVINETHPLFAGIYQGDASEETPKRIFEESDCLIMLGTMLSDITFNPSKFTKRQVISCNVKGLQVKAHSYPNIQFNEFCKALFISNVCVQEQKLEWKSKTGVSYFTPEKNKPITIDRIREKLDAILTQDMVVIADVGESLFLAGDLTIHHLNQFLSPAFYGSMGSAIPSAVGVQLAQPSIRPIVLAGDGAFRSSFSEISTIIEKKLNPIILVLNNKGYSTERVIQDGSFNNLYEWDYRQVVNVFGDGSGYRVTSEEDLDGTLRECLRSNKVSVIDVILDPRDKSAGLRRMIKSQSGN